MKKIRIFLLILAAMFAVQMYEPVTSCDVYAAAKTTTKKSTAKKKTKKKTRRMVFIRKHQRNTVITKMAKKSRISGKPLKAKNTISAKMDTH